jgi:hypothetical protein
MLLKSIIKEIHMKNANLQNDTTYRLVFGDLFDFVKKNTSADIIIPHVVNNSGSFNSGFAAAVEKYYPIVKANYDLMTLYKLGDNQFIKIDAGNKRNIVVVNMIAQNSNTKKKLRRQLNYFSLVKCMAGVNHYIKNNYSEFDANKFEIHAPKFGCGTSGGNWNFISDLIEDIWGGYSVCVYSPKRI